MSEKMKVALMQGIGKIEMAEMPVLHPAPGQVRVKVEYVGICGSDIHYYETGRIGDYIVEPPFVLGHESAGTVVELGEGVKNLQVGDRVTLEPGITCGQCSFCKKGQYNLCPDVVFFATPPIDGVFCEYVCHPEDLCFKLPDDVDSLEGALIEPLAVGFHAAFQGEAKIGQIAVVMGAGCIGLVSMMALKAMGISKVYVVDIMQKRLDKALELGATGVINAKEKDVVAEVKKLTGNEGCDLVIETAGTQATTVQAIEIARKGSNVVLVGYSKTGEMTLPMSLVLDKELCFKTVFRYRHIYPIAIDAVSSGKIDLKSIVTDVFPFDQTQKAMDMSVMLNSFVHGQAHIGLPTCCFDKTLEFYCLLGFSVVHTNNNPDTNEKVAFLELSGVMMEVYEVSDAALTYGAIDHVAFEVSDIDAVFDSIKGKGFTILDDKVMALPFWENGVRFFTIEGPNKEKLEFCQKC
jgi:L-iditol 2-dehydrogenase